MKINGLLLAAFLSAAAPNAMAQRIPPPKVVYKMFEDRVCKLMPAPYNGETVFDSMTGCTWKLTDTDGQPIAGETLTATASFGIDENEYRYMLGYFLGGYISLVQRSNGTATLRPFNMCQKEESVDVVTIRYSFRYDQDDEKAPPESLVQFHCDRAMIRLNATGPRSRAALETLASDMEALVRKEQAALDQAPQ